MPCLFVTGLALTMLTIAGEMPPALLLTFTLLLGAETGIRQLNDETGIEGLALRSDGQQFQTARFEQYWRR